MEKLCGILLAWLAFPTTAAACGSWAITLRARRTLERWRRCSSNEERCFDGTHKTVGGLASTSREISIFT